MSDQPMPVAILEWRPLKRNTLRGFATVRVGKALKIIDVTVHASNGKRYALLPSKAQIDTNGSVLRDQSGKIKYSPVVQWADKEASDRFSLAVVTAVEAQYPGATEGDVQ